MMRMDYGERMERMCGECVELKTTALLFPFGEAAHHSSVFSTHRTPAGWFLS
jgi:hypothetical protein